MITLITGGAGFIGSHLAERLIDDGDHVLILDDLSTGSRGNIAPLLAHARCELHRGSVMDQALVGSLVARADRVFHLAAAVGVKLVVEQPTLTIETNVRGTEVVLGAAARDGTLVVLASSSEVYGKGVKIPFAEEDDLRLGPTTKARWRYACSKAMDEYLALAYAQEHALPVIICRFFNTVGPRQMGRYGMVLPTFVQQALAGDDITVHGTGEQSRCFADVGEVVDCVVRLAASTSARSHVFNIGSQQEVTINQLARIVQRRTGHRGRIVHIPYADAYGEGFEDLERRLPDLDKLRRTIGIAPTRSIDDIVDHVVRVSAQDD